MKYANCGFEHAQQLRRAQRPAISQQRVVLFLNANPGELPEHIEVIRQFLELHQFHLPASILLGNHSLQRNRSVPMAAPRVMEQHLYFLHRPELFHRTMNGL
jgi:hypothetical protein